MNAPSDALQLDDADIELLIRNISAFTPEEQQEILELTNALSERKQAETCTNDLIEFCKHMQSDYLVGSHHKIIANVLMDISDGKKDRVSVSVAPRHGKEVAHSTPVLTPDGWTTHGQLQVGNFVFGVDGYPVEVLALSDEHQDDFLVSFTNGDTIRCHENHEWAVFDNSSHKWITVETGELFHSVLTRGEVGKRGGRYTFQIQNIAPIMYEHKNLPIDPYFLGVWLGDGTSSAASFVYHPADVEPRRELERRGFIVTSEYSHPDQPLIKAIFGYQNIKDTLADLEVWNNKHIPEIYLRSGFEQQLDLLAGLIDTDGHVERTTGRVRIATCTVALKNTLMDLLTCMGQRPYLYEQSPTISSSGIQGRQTVYYIGFQPTIDIPTRIPRKRITVVAPKLRKCALKSVEYLPDGSFGRCIQVDSPDGLYLVGKNLTPTHNSSLISLYFPAWFLGKYPNKKIMLVSHTTDLAVDFGRKVRNIVNSPQYRAIFPKTLIASDSKSAGRWNTSIGGEFYAAGIGSSIAGRGADLLLVDDAHSEQDVLNGNFEVFDRAYEWFTYGARTRLMPGGRIAVIGTRWHLNDLIGRLIRDMAQNEEADQYEVIEFPAVFEDESTGTQRALWPEFFTLEALLRTKASMPLFQWNAQYQQQPTAEEAAIVKREWWNTWTQDDPPDCDFLIMSLDAAAETHNRADFTAITVWGVFMNEEANAHNIILLNAIKRRIEFPELKTLSLEEYKYWEPDSFIVEKKSAGTQLYQELRRMGMPVQEFTPHRGTGDKMARLNSIADIIKSGLVWVPQTRWAEELVEEIAAFPFGQNDDLMDTCIMALMRFRQGGFIRLPTDEQDEPKFFKQRRHAYY